jgi:DNA primase
VISWISWDVAAAEPGPIHTRHDRPDGSKTLTWPKGTHPAELIYWATPDHRPPTGCPPVILCEGEKAADAVAAVGFAAAGTVCGASSTPEPTVLEHLDRAAAYLILSADHDEPGHRHMARIARALEECGAPACAWIEPPDDSPAGWDLADADPETRRRLICGSRWLLGFGCRRSAA